MATTLLPFDAEVVDEANVRALTGTIRWNPSSAITYFLTDSDINDNDIPDWEEDGARAALTLALEKWAAVANITFMEVGSAAAANLIESIGPADGNLGVHHLPGGAGGTQSAGEFNPFDETWTTGGLSEGGYAFVTLLHELGHALGLLEPHQDGASFDGIDSLTGGASDVYDLGAGDLNQGIYSIMSFNDGYALSGGSPSDNYGWQAGPGAFDIAAIQELYGANLTHATGNDIYVLPDDNVAGTFYETIWDAGGTDEIRYNGSRDVVISLRAATLAAEEAGGGVLSAAEGIHGGFTIANGVLIENASGGTGDDLLAGNAADNQLNGGAGHDVLFGHDGNDLLIGGDGDDLLIGDQDLSGIEAHDTPVVSGLSFGAGTMTAGQGTLNATINTAIDLSSSFAVSSNGNVENSTSTPHVTVTGTGNGQVDVFAITLANPFATVTLDIDGASFDSFIFITDDLGDVLRFNDNASIAEGAAGSITDTDSYLRFSPMTPGTYYIAVGAADPEAVSMGVPDGGTYTLHVSVEDEIAATRYSALLDLLDGFHSGMDGMG